VGKAVRRMLSEINRWGASRARKFIDGNYMGDNKGEEVSESHFSLKIGGGSNSVIKNGFLVSFGG